MAEGQLHKMRTHLDDEVLYELQLGNEKINMNALIGKSIRLEFTGEILCVSCGKRTKKSFGQGFCYPCFINSPENAECIVRPELCRGHLHEGRDVQWELDHHVQPHTVYLALSSGLKVGVTRDLQIPTRWIDQGANSAIVIAETPYRQLAGAIEVELKNHFADKTNWQRMLKNDVPDDIDLVEEKNKIKELLSPDLQNYISEFSEIVEINYPVKNYPLKVKSLNFDKVPIIEGELNGIKGQYLMFSNGNVLNIRNQSGYVIKLSYA